MALKTSKSVVYAASAGNLLVTLTKFAAASWTGSAAMLSEAIHSLVDTANQLLLVYGIHRADRPPDEKHPLGYGRELYFWSFIVALFMLTIGAGLSCYEGIQHISNPTAIENGHISYIVHMSPDQIVVALAFEFNDDLTTPQIEKIVANLERAIHKAHPDVIAVFAKPQPRPQAESAHRPW